MSLITEIIDLLDLTFDRIYPRQGLMIFVEEFLLEKDESVEENIKIREDKNYTIIGYVNGDKFYDIITKKVYPYHFGVVFDGKRRFSPVSIQTNARGLYLDDVDEYVCQPLYRHVGNKPFTSINERTFYLRATAKLLKSPEWRKFSLKELNKVKTELNNRANNYWISLKEFDKYLLQFKNC